MGRIESIELIRKGRQKFDLLNQNFNKGFNNKSQVCRIKGFLPLSGRLLKDPNIFAPFLSRDYRFPDE